MADVIGPSQYSQMLGSEKTPEEQGVLAGGVNWSGTRGGGADIQLAPGGEFAQQAQIDTEGFNKILSFAGSKVKQKVDEASYKAYWEGVQKAANGEAAENLQTQKVKTGIWEKLVPDKVMETGYNDYMAFTNMTKVQSEFMKDMEALAEKDPAEVQKAWVNAVSNSLTGNKMQDERILELSTPLGGEVFKQAAFKRQEYLKAQETNARTAASIATAEQVKTLYKNINPENAQDTIVKANAIMGGAFEKQDNETYAEHQARIAATIDGYSEAGNPAIFNYYKQNGMLSQMSTANQIAFAKAEDIANNKAAIDYIKENPQKTAQLDFDLQNAQTEEEQNAKIDEFNAEFMAKTGATEPAYDKNKYFLQSKLQVAERKQEQIAVENANKQRAAADAVQLKVLEMAREGKSRSEIFDFVQSKAKEFTAAGMSTANLPDGNAINSAVENKDNTEAEIAKKQIEREREKQQWQALKDTTDYNRYKAQLDVMEFNDRSASFIDVPKDGEGLYRKALGDWLSVQTPEKQIAAFSKNANTDGEFFKGDAKDIVKHSVFANLNVLVGNPNPTREAISTNAALLKAAQARNPMILNYLGVPKDVVKTVLETDAQMQEDPKASYINLWRDNFKKNFGSVNDPNESSKDTDKAVDKYLEGLGVSGHNTKNNPTAQYLSRKKKQFEDTYGKGSRADAEFDLFFKNNTAVDSETGFLFPFDPAERRTSYTSILQGNKYGVKPELAAKALYNITEGKYKSSTLSIEPTKDGWMVTVIDPDSGSYLIDKNGQPSTFGIRHSEFIQEYNRLNEDRIERQDRSDKAKKESNEDPYWFLKPNFDFW